MTSFRGVVEGMPTRQPLAGMLPAVYAEDDFTGRFLAGLDEVVAPILATLDCFDAYLDPALAPADFLDWLATWVALPLQEGWGIERRRKLVAMAIVLHRTRGTATGMADLLETVTGGRVEVIESGGCVASSSPGGPLPGSPTADMTVRLIVADPSTVHSGRIDALITANKPAHMRHALEIVSE